MLPALMLCAAACAHGAAALPAQDFDLAGWTLQLPVGSKSATFDYTAATWKGDTYCFKAGAYVQDNAGSGAEGGKVAFYGLDIPHSSGLTMGGTPRTGGGTPEMGGRSSSRTLLYKGMAGPGFRIRSGTFDAGGREARAPGPPP